MDTAENPSQYSRVHTRIYTQESMQEFVCKGRFEREVPRPLKIHGGFLAKARACQAGLPVSNMLSMSANAFSIALV